MTLPAHAQASAAFRRWCLTRSDSVFRRDGKRGMLLRLLGDIPTTPFLLPCRTT